MANNETYFSHFLSMFEAKAREYFQGACRHFLVPATEVPDAVQLVFSMELLAISSMSEVGSEFVLGLPSHLQRVLCRTKITPPGVENVFFFFKPFP